VIFTKTEYKNVGLDALFACDICLYIPVDSTLLYSAVALECKLCSSSALQVPRGSLYITHRQLMVYLIGRERFDSFIS
jgi:hypothetical protein